MADLISEYAHSACHYSFLQKTRDRSSEISKCFSLVDQESKGYITSQDIARLSEEAGEYYSSSPD
jgi:Ca2+-binding EF-hand superfamily protein